MTMNDMSGPAADLTESIANIPERYVPFRYELYCWDDFTPRGYKVLQLSKGYFAVVSLADYKRVAKHNWSANVQVDPVSGEILKVYAYRKRTKLEKSRGAPVYVYLHRFLKGVVYAGKNQVVDHLNGDTLDCRRRNLLVTGQSNNLGNMATTVRPVNKNTPRGVKPVKHRRKDGEMVVSGWRGRIRVRGKERYSRIAYSCPERAHRWYLRMHRIFFPVGDSWRDRSSVPKLRLPKTVEEVLTETIPF